MLVTTASCVDQVAAERNICSSILLYLKVERTFTTEEENFNFAALASVLSACAVVKRKTIKGKRWMPWRCVPTKDVAGDERPRGAASER